MFIMCGGEVERGIWWWLVVGGCRPMLLDARAGPLCQNTFALTN